MSHPNNDKIIPFLKWAGGKRWLHFYYSGLFPSRFNLYLEPFVGGAAVFFWLRPKRAILSDINDRLIGCYQQMRDHPARLFELMKRHQEAHSAEYYYEMRKKKLKNPLKQAGQFLYLNRTCWNGLYRVNLSGEFNVPIGTKSGVVFEGKLFEEYARLLSVAEINACDYQETILRANEGDFLFVDPPYTVKHNFNGFAKYNENIFSWADQKRLRRSLDVAAKRGVKILLSNAHHDSVLELFGDLGIVHIIKRRSTISGKADGRSTVTEIAVTVNYDVPSLEDSTRTLKAAVDYVSFADPERRAV